MFPNDEKTKFNVYIEVPSAGIRNHPIPISCDFGRRIFYENKLEELEPAQAQKKYQLEEAEKIKFWLSWPRKLKMLFEPFDDQTRYVYHICKYPERS